MANTHFKFNQFTKMLRDVINMGKTLFGYTLLVTVNPPINFLNFNIKIITPWFSYKTNQLINNR